MNKPDIAVRALGDDDAEAMARFFAATWGSAGTGADVIAERDRQADINPYQPGTRMPAWGMVQDGEVIGYVTAFPNRFRVGDTESCAPWITGFMVREEYRNGPVGYSVLKQAARETQAAGALTVMPASFRLFAAVGFKDLGALPDCLALLDPAGILRRMDPDALELSPSPWLRRLLKVAAWPPVAAVCGAGLGCARRLWLLAVRPGGAARCEVRDDAGAASREVLDRIWERCRRELHATVVRSGAFVRWRYIEQHAAQDYRALTAWQDEQPLGYAIVKPPAAAGDPRLNGIRIAVVSDLLYPPSAPQVGDALLEAAERLARRLGAHALMVSPSHRSPRALLRRRACVERPGRVHFLVKGGESFESVPEDLSAWWIMRGDAHSDTTF
ncbi:MAG: GNAT family N-acetyltransferase [Pseudomonadota bacterium]|nr:GNAT family N-acetyltransferase [Pseudomonadota bacterium]